MFDVKEASRLAVVRSPQRQWLGNLTLLVTTLLVILVPIEVLLRLRPDLLGEQFSNKVFSKYTTRPDGIYYKDPSMKMQFMKPNFVTENYWNGYRWHHETDDLGFRNPRTRSQADILLVGDSYIYGHGVNIDETVGMSLERRISYSVINLGTHGYSAFQEAYLVAEYVPKFKPRYVFYFFYDNDISELYKFLTDQEMRDFIQHDLRDISYKVRTEPSRLIRGMSWSEAFRPRLYVSMAYDLLRTLLKWHLRKWMPQIQRHDDQMHDEDNEDSLAWQYTKHAILFMASVTKGSHAKFVIVPINLYKEPYYDILQKFAGQHRLMFLEQAQLSKWDSTHFLTRDSHFSGKGADAMAQLLSDFIRDQEAAD